MQDNIEIQSAQQDIYDLNTSEGLINSSPNEKITAANLQIIFNKVRTNFQEFVKSLGIVKDQKLNLQDYKLSGELKCVSQYTTIQTILQILDNIIRKIKNNKKKKINWNLEDATLLIWILEKYKASRNKISIKHFTDADWEFIASLIPFKTGSQCMFKCFNIQKNNQNQAWTQDQDKLLKELTEQFQCNHHRWKQISKNLYIRNSEAKIFRNPKKCRQRWQCFLNPNIRKGPWTSQQDFKLLQLSFDIGKKWAQISKILAGRTQNAVKNRFQLLADKSRKKPYQNLFSSEDQFLIRYMNELQINLMINIQQEDPMQIYLKKRKQSKKQTQKKEMQKQTQSLRQQVKQTYAQFLEYYDDQSFGQHMKSSNVNISEKNSNIYQKKQQNSN